MAEIKIIERLETACSLNAWNINIYDEGDDYYMELENTSSRGQDIVVGEHISDPEDEDGIEIALYDMWQHYDPDEEASLWIGDGGHGMNGAPDSMRDILDDMEEVKDMLKELYKDYRKGIKEKAITGSQLNELQYAWDQAHKMDSIINGVEEVLKEINRQEAHECEIEELHKLQERMVKLLGDIYHCEGGTY